MKTYLIITNDYAGRIVTDSKMNIIKTTQYLTWAQGMKFFYLLHTLQEQGIYVSHEKLEPVGPESHDHLREAKAKAFDYKNRLKQA
jgi:hypothetical protein